MLVFEGCYGSEITICTSAVFPHVSYSYHVTVRLLYTLLILLLSDTNSEIKQKNEGGWEFYWDEESRPGMVVLEVRVQKFLDSSLIDVDVHPTYVSMVIKSKVSG